MDTEKYDPIAGVREWMQHTETGENYRPVVMIRVDPKIGETKGSIWGNILSGALTGNNYYGSHKYEFKADLKEMTLMSDSTVIEPLERSMAFVPLDFISSNWSGKHWGEDMARCGVFMFSPTIFTPTDTSFPPITLELFSIEKPDKPTVLKLSKRTMKRIWDDFEVMRTSTVPIVTDSVPQMK